MMSTAFPEKGSGGHEPPRIKTGPEASLENACGCTSRLLAVRVVLLAPLLVAEDPVGVADALELGRRLARDVRQPVAVLNSKVNLRGASHFNVGRFGPIFGHTRPRNPFKLVGVEK
jgi:hypothetical protein